MADSSALTYQDMIDQDKAMEIVAAKYLTDGDEVGALLVAPSLRSEVGAILRDIKVLAIEEGNHERAGTYPIITIKYVGQDGAARVGMLHCVHTVLQEQMASLNVQVGDTIDGIASLGERVKDDGETYGLWRVIGAQREIRAYDWAARKNTKKK